MHPYTQIPFYTNNYKLYILFLVLLPRWNDQPPSDRWAVTLKFCFCWGQEPRLNYFSSRRIRSSEVRAYNGRQEGATEKLSSLEVRLSFIFFVFSDILFTYFRGGAKACVSSPYRELGAYNTMVAATPWPLSRSHVYAAERSIK